MAGLVTEAQKINIGNKNFDRNQDNDKKPKIKTRGFIINKTGRNIYSPKDLERRYCSDYLDAGETCRHVDKCHFVNAVYPGEFTEHDKHIVA